MPELAKRDLCTGCTACVSICPVQCLQMNLDKDGFEYPKIIDETKCISCGKCERACPVLKKNEMSNKVEVFAAYSKDKSLRADSSSGGIFSEIAYQILDDGGYVYGAAYDEQGVVRHICVDKLEMLAKLRGAKYSQSFLGDCYCNIKKQLDLGNRILFSGTPCQVAGLKAFLRKEYTNLICVDFVCHGVPSPVIWNNFVKWRAKQDNEGVYPQKINMRDKQTGWSRYRYSTVFSYKEKQISCLNSQNLFMKLFVGDYINRESCSNCKFKGYQRYSDITLGDFWGIWDILPEMDDDQGTSLVMLNSDKGRQMWKKILGNIVMQQVTLEEASRQNPSLLVSSSAKKNRSEVLEKAIQGQLEELEKIFQKNENQKVSIWNKLKQIFLG